MIGLYISEHPLAGVARSLASRTSCPISELSEEMAGQTVTVGGFIASLRLIPTKKGDLMAAIELEDMSGSTELIVFPRLLQSQRELLKEDAIILVRGKVDTRDDRAKVLAESVEPLEPGAEDELMAGELDAVAGAQTGYPMDEIEEEAAAFGEGARLLAEARATARRAGPLGNGRHEPPPYVAEEPPLPAERLEPVVEQVWPAETQSAREVVSTALYPLPPPKPLAAAGRHVLEVTIERTALQDRDVNRMIRLSELFDRFPGSDAVVLLLVSNTRDTTVLSLGEGVRCCPDLLDQVIQEVGEHCVTLRQRGADHRPAGDSMAGDLWPCAGIDGETLEAHIV